MTAGMIMHRSHLPLKTWFMAVHIVTSHSNCQRRSKIRPKGGAKDCHLGWWSDLGVRLGVGDAVRGFSAGAGSGAMQSSSGPRPPAARRAAWFIGLGSVSPPGLRGALPAGAGRRRAAVQLSALFLRARLWLRR